MLPLNYFWLSHEHEPFHRDHAKLPYLQHLSPVETLNFVKFYTGVYMACADKIILRHLK
jgi:hypothetical protein